MRAAEGELALTQKALMRNPKSYSAWHHRRWVVRRRLTSLEAEVKLVEALLDADDRNFHGWLYRMFLADVRGGGWEGVPGVGWGPRVCPAGREPCAVCPGADVGVQEASPGITHGALH